MKKIAVRKWAVGLRTRLDFTDIFARWATILILLLLILGGSILRPNTFPTWTNTVNILTFSSFFLIVASGLTICVVVGEWDLSIGSVVTLGAVVSTSLIANHGMSVPLAIVISLLSGLAIGILNGLLVTRLRIHSFIATLATLSIALGIAFWVSGGASIFRGLGSNYTFLGRAKPILGIPLPVFISLAIALIIWFVLTRTVVGRHLYAIGANSIAAYITGIAVDRYRVLAFVVSGFLAALTGILYSARLAYSDVSIGTAFLLPGFAAVFIGAATLKKGEFHIPGTIVGAVLLQIILVLVVMLNLPQAMSQIFQGIALAGAVGLSTIMMRRRG